MTCEPAAGGGWRHRHAARGIVDQSGAPTVFCMFSFLMQIIDERPGVRYPDRSSGDGIAISSCAAGDRISYTDHNDRRL